MLAGSWLTSEMYSSPLSLIQHDDRQQHTRRRAAGLGQTNTPKILHGLAQRWHNGFFLQKRSMACKLLPCIMRSVWNETPSAARIGYGHTTAELQRQLEGLPVTADTTKAAPCRQQEDLFLDTPQWQRRRAIVGDSVGSGGMETAAVGYTQTIPRSSVLGRQPGIGYPVSCE